MGLFQKFKEVFQSKKQREEELKNLLENDKSEELDDDLEKDEEIIEEVTEEDQDEIAYTDESIHDEEIIDGTEVIEEAEKTIVQEVTKVEEDAEVEKEEVAIEEVEDDVHITEDEPTEDKEVEEKEEIIEKVQEKAPSKKKKKGLFKLSERDVDLVTYDKGLEKTRKEFVSELTLLGKRFTKVTEEYYEELENLLIKADIGVTTVFKFLDRLRDRVKHENITDTSYLTEVIVDELFMIYVEGESLTDKINIAEEGPTVILMVGVNGVGKTTTIGKLANKYKNEGKKVMLIAGDTFRAGAVPQLEEWANRTNSLFYGKENTDPAGVIFDGLVKAKEENVDIVLIDTAGRLQNKVNLMNELEKINKVIGKHVPNAPHETLLIIDATTGQNGISQAESFKSITNITGIVLTKLDGTAKGGIVLAIKEVVGLPVKFVGLGEGVNDLRAFDIEDYIYGLFKDMM
ncbi:MAG: signal recognition particle-docking protein FtsY [Erysipelotrichales bacterium]|nr:signal recognition particle-docking protein FtsY [Erysipelotrichales bacterium]